MSKVGVLSHFKVHGIEMDETRRFPVTVEDANFFLKTTNTFEHFLLKLEENHLDIDSLLIKIKVESFRGEKHVEKNGTEYRIMEFSLSDSIEYEEMADKNSSPESQDFPVCRLCGVCTTNSVEILNKKDAVAQKINCILPINIFKEDNVPVTVCKNCCTKVNALSDFTTQCLQNEQKLLNIATSISSTENESVEIKKDTSKLQFKQTCPHCYANILIPQNNQSLNFQNDLQLSLCDDNASNLELENILNEAISLNLESESILNDITTLNLEADTILNDFANSNPECDAIFNEASPSNVERSNPNSEDSKAGYEISKPISEESEEISELSNPILDKELEVQCTRIESLSSLKPIDIEIIDDLNNAVKFENNSPKKKKRSIKTKKKRNSKFDSPKSKKQRKEIFDSFHNEKKDLKCILCNLEFLSHDRHLFHIEQHENSNLGNFTCQKCKTDLSTEDELWKHCQNDCLPDNVASLEEASDFNAEDKIICKVCKALFILKERYEFHMELHESGDFEVLKCSKCNKVFETETVLWDHHQTEHKRFACVGCERIFRRKASLDYHLKTSGHPNVDNFEDEKIKITDSPKSKLLITCAKCGARYRRQERYEFHVKRHELGQINLFICTECEKEFTNENMLWDHYQYTHRKTECFTCLTCSKVFQKQFLLNKHQIKSKHKGRKEIDVESKSKNQSSPVGQNRVKSKTKDTVQPKFLGCVLCGEAVSNFDSDSLNDAVTCAKCKSPELSLQVDSDGAKVISRREYDCNLCYKHFSTKDRLEYHIMRHSENMDEFICSTCGKTLSTEQALFEHHLFVHKGARPHVCELCGKSYQFRTRLKEHMRTHSGERPFACEVCSQDFMTNNALRSHLKTHLDDKKFPCQLCSKLFRRQQDLNEHLERHWKNDKIVNLSRFFHCENCSEFFPTIRVLKTHLKEHHGVENGDLTDLHPWFQCEDCPEKFKHQMSLKSHREKVHKGKTKPIYRCDKCDVIYKTARLLASHMNNHHGGEKRYKCAQCGKEYNQSKSLQSHILIHTGEKPFKCDICEMTFRTKESRNHHQRKHTGEKPYKCPGCDKTFATAGQRREHRRKTHEDGNELPCPECGKICFGERGVRSHLTIHSIEKRKMLALTEFVKLKSK